MQVENNWKDCYKGALTSETWRLSPTNIFLNSGFDTFCKLLPGPSEKKINILFLSPMADFEEASVKQLIHCANRIYFSNHQKK